MLDLRGTTGVILAANNSFNFSISSHLNGEIRSSAQMLITCFIIPNSGVTANERVYADQNGTSTVINLLAICQSEILTEPKPRAYLYYSHLAVARLGEVRSTWEEHQYAGVAEERAPIATVGLFACRLNGE